MTSRTRLVVLLVSAPIIAFTVIGGFLGRVVAREDTYRHLRVFEDVVSLILSNYVEEVDLDGVLQGALRGLSDGLDADSAYLSAEEVRLLEGGDAMPPGRVGLELTRQYYLQVIAARDNSPAARAGLQPGDYVRSIDGQPTRNISVFTGSRLFRGRPGSTISLTVLRGSAAEPHEIELVREELTAPDVTGRILAPGVGYLRLAAFGPDVADQIVRRTGELARAGATRLVIDVRRTAEGPLDAGLAAARLFIPSGALIIREANGDTRETIHAEAGDGAIRWPAIVLVNGGTAGAAELFAAALADRERAQLVGTRTFGRTAIQKLINLPDGSGLWLSWAHYLTASGAPIHRDGLQPTLVVEEPSVGFGADPPDADPVLDKALETLTLQSAA